MKISRNFDYYGAFLLRYKDFEHLINQENEESIIFAVYCGGVCIECMLCSFIQKTYIDKDTLEATLPDHNISSLYGKCSHLFTDKNKHEINEYILTINEHWSNELRYFSKSQFKKKIISSIAKNKKISLKAYYKKMIDAVKEIYKTGELNGKY